MRTLPLEDLKPVSLQIKETLEALPAGARIALCAHTRPDGDAIGSVSALSAALHQAGYDTCPLLADNRAVPQTYRWLPQTAYFQQPSQLAEDTAFDLFIVLDTPQPARLACAQTLCRQAKRRILIDHHPSREPYTDLALVCTQAAATGQLIWELLETLGLSRTEEVATATYVAMASDTGLFAFSNTNEAVLTDAAAMVAAGAVPSAIAYRLFAQKPLEALKLDELILSRISLENGGAVVVSYYSDDDLRRIGVSHDWTENLVDLIRVVEGIEVAALITCADSGPRVSLRSAGGFDVSAVAAHFGGGGHAAAAGITWPQRKATGREVLAALLPLLPHKSEGESAHRE